MQSLRVADFPSWRTAARPLLIARIAPGEIEWAGGLDPGEADGPTSASAHGGSGATPHGEPLMISASLVRLLEAVSMFRHGGRWELMYRLAYRAVTGSPRVLEDAADPDVRVATRMAKTVRRDIHKMHAFVRFREVSDECGGMSYFAWFEPAHDILACGAQFFRQRFPHMRWAIATPDGTAVWADQTLRIVPPPRTGALGAPPANIDPCEDLWRAYYRSICNVARINVPAMQREMPKRYWRLLPEAREIAALVREAEAGAPSRPGTARRDGIALTAHGRRSLPPGPAALDESPQSCRRCGLWERATQAVLGEGSATARLMLVGEQPGNEEDLRGRPFIGPAGGVLDAALAAAGLARSAVYITNAVKHFKWEPRGKRRLHKRPGTAEIDACNVWLEQEIVRVSPRVIVALGATALRALGGTAPSIESARTLTLKHGSGARLIATYHPSAILRAEGERARVLQDALQRDLRSAAQWLAAPQA